MADNIDQMGLEAFFEAQAAAMTEDPDKRLLIQEGLRLFYQSRFSGPALPINQATSFRFYLDVSPEGILTLWDYYTLAVYMASVSFGDHGCTVENARTGKVLQMSKGVANGFWNYLTQTIQGFEEHAQKNGAKFYLGGE